MKIGRWTYPVVKVERLSREQAKVVYTKKDGSVAEATVAVSKLAA